VTSEKGDDTCDCERRGQTLHNDDSAGWRALALNIAKNKVIGWSLPPKLTERLGSRHGQGQLQGFP